MSQAGSTCQNLSRHKLVRALAALAIGASSAAAQAAVIYSQPEVGVDPNAAVFDSQNAGAVGTIAVFDDFLFAGGATVTDVHWTGGFFGGSETNENITGVTVSFYDDAAGQPGALNTAYFFGGNASQTNLHPCANITRCFNYSVDLPALQPFVAAVNTRYWLSVVVDQTFPPRWGWDMGTGGNGIAYQRVGAGPLNNVGVDFAFDLTNDGVAPVPEPATLTLLGFGLAGLGFARRRKSS